MISKIDKKAERVKRHKRIRNHISGTDERPRLCVYRSEKHIYAQIIVDFKRVNKDETIPSKTLCAASTVEPEIAEQIKDMNKSEAAVVVGKALATKALALGIKQVVFDRGGYIYTGRVQKLAEGAREGGLDF